MTEPNFTENQELILTVGLPRSGKTTWSKAMNEKYGYPVVCPDAIRMALGCYPFVAEREGEVWHHAKVQVESLFAFGHSKVILDSTCIRSVYRNQWNVPGRVVTLVVFDATAQECIDRALAGNKDYLKRVIERMASVAEWPTAGSFVTPTEML